MPTLRLSSRAQVFGDVAPGQPVEPLQRYVDWERFVSGVPAAEVNSDHHIVDPGATLSLVALTFTNAVADPGALFSFSAHPTKAGRYQVRYTGGAVANPLASLGTGLVTPGNTYVVTTNPDGTINLSDTSLVPVNFGSTLKRGDKVYIAGSNFGDTGSFSIVNQGFWSVVTTRSVGANPGAMVVLARIDKNDMAGVDETVTAAAAMDVQALALAGATLLMGPLAYSGFWSIVESASGWISIDSIESCPDLLGVHPDAFCIVPESFLGYFRIEVDGMAQVTTKSDNLTNGQSILRPVKFSDPLATPVGGWMEAYGGFNTLSVKNLTDKPLGVNVILAFLEM